MGYDVQISGILLQSEELHEGRNVRKEDLTKSFLDNNSSNWRKCVQSHGTLITSEFPNDFT